LQLIGRQFAVILQLTPQRLRQSLPRFASARQNQRLVSLRLGKLTVGLHKPVFTGCRGRREGDVTIGHQLINAQVNLACRQMPHRLL
jgi:hypothetical protein